jgi:hypothetical protein
VPRLSSFKSRNRLNGSIDRKPRQQVIVFTRCFAVPQWLPGYSSLGISGRNQELVEERMDPRPNCAGSVLLFLKERRGYDDIGIDGPQRYPELLCRRHAPLFRIAHWVLVADYQARAHLLAEFLQLVIRIPAQDQSHIAGAQPFTNIGNPCAKKV